MPGTPRSIAQLEDWFQTGDKPTQQQFYDLFASFTHYLQIKQVTGASTSDVMSQKAVTDELEAAVLEAITTLRDGVPSGGDTLNKLYDLIAGLEANKLDITDYNQHFKGKFTTLAALNSAYTPLQLEEGDYAQVNEVGATTVKNYSWDTEDEVWVEGASGSGATTTDDLPEGSTNLYFTTARVLATVLTGLSLATGTAITSSDTVLSAFGKLQKQITDLTTTVSGFDQDLIEMSYTQSMHNATR